jgi:hypothetical protein
MSETTIALKPPAELKAAHEKAQRLAAQGREVVAAFTQGVAIDPAKVAELTEALCAGNARFRKEWAAQRTRLRDGREVFTPDYLAVKNLLDETPLDIHQFIAGIDEQGRVLEVKGSGVVVSNLAHVSALTMLQVLWLSGDQIQDLSPLSGLKALRSLRIEGHNRFQDLGPLSALTALQELFLNSHQIESLSPLSGLSALRRLWLGANQNYDLTPISDLPSLKFLLVLSSSLSAESDELLKRLEARGVEVRILRL